MTPLSNQRIEEIEADLSMHLMREVLEHRAFAKDVKQMRAIRKGLQYLHLVLCPICKLETNKCRCNWRLRTELEREQNNKQAGNSMAASEVIK
jgi:hypothetical protein